ncbi:MAG: hypothetical protein Q7S22_00260 [Candidatus Micrarchaeota archaeon]|nr:hypothetical protein [Candidatus Micrarchaeota archaeon]
MENRVLAAILIFSIILIAGCIENKVDFYSPDNNCSDIGANYFDNPACSASCKSYEACVKSVTLPTADGLGQLQCYTCFNIDITSDLIKMQFTGSSNIITKSNESVELKWDVTGNVSKIKTVRISDKFKDAVGYYDAEFDNENNQIVLKKIMESGEHLLKAEARLDDNTEVSSEETRVVSDEISNVYCCTNDYNLYWDNVPKSSVNDCPDLGEPEGKMGYLTPIEAEHGCIFGFICQTDGTMKKVRGQEHRDAVDAKKTVYSNPEGINCVNMTASNNDQPKTVYNVNFELLDINKGYSRVEKLPYGSTVHFVVASTSVDIRNQLPITIVMKVNEEEVFRKVIPNEPEYNCRDATGCSTDGPLVLNEWIGKEVILDATNKDGELLVEYSE